MNLLRAVLSVACIMVTSAYGSYAGYKIVRAHLEHPKQVEMVSAWNLDVWSHESNLMKGWNDIRVNQTHIDGLGHLQIDFEVLIDDVEGLITAERKELADHDQAANWFTAYHPYSDIVAFLKNLSVVYPKLVQYVPSIGKTTIQGNNIPAIIITGTATGTKKKIFWSAQQHAREWIASHTVLYILDQLLAKYNTDSVTRQILDGAVFHIIPLVNPDGYLYTWASNGQRLWRKNRRNNGDGTYGVDLNRNWNDHWGGQGSSSNPASDTYHGTKAFSEPESTAVSAYVTANGPFYAGIDWHCYSQLILRPFGWTSKAPANEKVAKALGDGMRDKIYAVNKVQYTSEASWELYYTTGSAQDWYFSEAGMPLSYTIELRDEGKYGFVLPPSEIIPCGNENLAAAKYFAQHVIAA